MKAVVDTNVLLVANGQHPDISSQCVEACVARLLALQEAGTVVIDDGFRILGEYRHKTSTRTPKGVGDVFLKWLLRNAGNPARVQVVALTETGPDQFAEFPDAALQARFDPSDRKFVATAAAHRDRPPLWQAADCKWLNWWPALAAAGLRVEFLCPEDVGQFFQRKFPNLPLPALPGD